MINYAKRIVNVNMTTPLIPLLSIHSRYVNDPCFGFRAYSLFYDESRSVQFLAEYQKEFLFNEDTNVGMEDDSEDDEEDIKKEETANMETTDN